MGLITRHRRPAKGIHHFVTVAGVFRAIRADDLWYVLFPGMRHPATTATSLTEVKEIIQQEADKDHTCATPRP